MPEPVNTPSGSFSVARPRLSAGRVVVWFGFLLSASIAAQQVPVVEKTLSNGMKLLMVERHDEPTVSGGWVAHVGSANERPGITGIAHLFEHMMFKGTPTIGTTNWSPSSPAGLRSSTCCGSTCATPISAESVTVETSSTDDGQAEKGGGITHSVAR